MNELREWVLANAMQSKRPEIGEEIIDALAELDQLRRDYALLQVSVMSKNCELKNRGSAVKRLNAEIERLKNALATEKHKVELLEFYRGNIVQEETA